MKSSWILQPLAPADWFKTMNDIPPLEAQLCWNKGLTASEAARKFLAPDIRRDLHDPFLFVEVTGAITRIRDAFRKGEKVAIWGDYDCDGVCGTTILYEAFSRIGDASLINVHIPDRNAEGYGLSMGHLEELAKAGVTLLVTVDCGVTDVKEITWAKEHGIDVIVADHHSVPKDLPPAYAIVNPKDPRSGYPFPGLAGTAVAFKLAQALLRSAGYDDPFTDGTSKDASSPVLGFLELVALATLADAMPMRDENRAMVQEGLMRLGESSRLGLQELFAFCKIRTPVSGRDMLFSVIPLINAMGRMEHASISFRLFTTTDPDEARSLIRHLDERNRERQLATDVIVQEVQERLSASPIKTPVVFEMVERRLPGVLGLAAQRVMDIVGRPVVLAIADEETGRVTGNGRALGDFNIVSVFQNNKDLFFDAGGHPHAAGFSASLSNLDAARDAFYAAGEAVESRGGFLQEDRIPIDAEMTLSNVNAAAFNDVRRLSPFGQENTEPQFLFRALTVEEARAVGNEGNHLKLRFSQNGTQIGGIAFRKGSLASVLSRGSNVDVVAKLSQNTWNSRTTIELDVVDLDVVS